MHLKSVIRRVQNIERQHNPPTYTFVWQDQNGQYLVDGETMDEAAYQRWCAQRGSGKIVYILAWR
jgi:beta-glucanase (GH16 family)